MTQKIIGLDIGIYSLKVSLVRNGLVLRSVSEKYPDHMAGAGQDISPQTLAAFIRETLKKNKISGKEVSVSLPADMYYIRRLKMPLMTVQQLAVNLPYEFRDYITGDLDQYVYDYSVLHRDEKEMDLMAACMPSQQAAWYRDMIKHAGYKLVKLVPDVLCLQSILFKNASPGAPSQDYAVLDLGHRATRMYFFSHGAYEITRTLDNGGPAMARAIADAMGLDLYTAQQYLEQNKDHVMELPAVTDQYEEVNTEITRVMNFYSYNNSDNNIDTIYYFGNGFEVSRLTESIRETTGLKLLPLSSLAENAQQAGALKLGPASFGCVIE